MSFTSLDVILHSEALLSAINFLSLALSNGTVGRDNRPAAEDQLSTKSSQYQGKLCVPDWSAD